MPREGTLLAAEKKKLDEALASSKPKGSENAVPEDTAQTNINQQESEKEDTEMRSSEEDYEKGWGKDDEAFFYDEKEVLPEEEKVDITARVVVRR